MIIKKAGKYLVYDSKGERRLGTHNTLKSAREHLKAIEASKAARR